MIGQPDRRSRAVLVAITVLLVLGAAVRTVQFASGNSLWHDEMMLARNVEERGLVELVGTPSITRRSPRSDGWRSTRRRRLRSA